MSGKAGECRRRPRRYQVDPWSRGREVARGVLRSFLPSLRKGLFFAIGEGSRIFAACFLHSSAQMCLYQTPGPRPPPITGRFMKTVTRGWVGAPNERTPFRFHDAVVGFVDRCLSRTRNLAASNKHLVAFFSGRSWPNIGPGIIFSGFSYSLNCFWKICAHSERYRNLLAGIFEIRFFYGNIAFPLSPVSQQLFLFLFLFLFSSIYQALSDGSTWKPERSGTFGWLIMAYLCLQV